MGNNCTLISTEPWANGVKSQVSFDYSPEVCGNHNYVFRGNAFHPFNYNSIHPVVVRCHINGTGTDKTWESYLQSASDVSTFAVTFNQDMKNRSLPYKIVFVSPTAVCIDTTAFATELCRKLGMHSKKFHEDEIVVFEEYLGKTLLTLTDDRGELRCDDARVVDTFAHFIYEESNHAMSISNVRGTCLKNSFELVIPHVNTRTGNYGNGDRGMTGISDFLKHHRCNDLCKELVKASDNFTYSREPQLPPYS